MRPIAVAGIAALAVLLLTGAFTQQARYEGVCSLTEADLDRLAKQRIVSWGWDCVIIDTWTGAVYPTGTQGLMVLNATGDSLTVMHTPGILDKDSIGQPRTIPWSPGGRGGLPPQ